MYQVRKRDQVLLGYVYSLNGTGERFEHPSQKMYLIWCMLASKTLVLCTLSLKFLDFNLHERDTDLLTECTMLQLSKGVFQAEE